jgi:hypothetical protein
MAGKKVKCPGCGAVLSVAAAAPPATPSKPPPLPAHAAEDPPPKDRNRLAFQLWQLPRTEGQKVNLLGLHEEILIAGDTDDKNLKESVADLEEGLSREKLEDLELERFPLDEVQLQAGPTSLQITISNIVAKKPNKTKATFQNEEQQEDFLGALEALPGPGWDVRKERQSRAFILLRNLVIMLAVGGLTGVIYWAFEGGHVRRAPALIVALVTALGTNGILGVGGLIIAIVLIFTVMQLLKPPDIAYWTQREGERSRE